MKLITVMGVLILLAAFFPSAQAHASLHHDHHSAVSLFHAKSNGKPMHCILRGHSTGNPCPHILHSKKQSQTIAIGHDCGGSPYPAKSLLFPPLKKLFLSQESLIEKTSIDSENYFQPPELYNSSIFKSIDHPPKS